MDEQTIRRLMHQKRKDEYKVDVLKLKYELAKQKDTNKFLKIMQIVLIAMMMITFVGIITVNNNAETTLGTRLLNLFYERGYLEK
jgi:hypothetical protein